MNTPSSALSDEMKGAMSTLLNAVIFEQWLRFSWIEEDEEGDFCIQIPAETVSELVEDYPEYEGLIAQLNGTIVDADMACSAVLGYARSSLGEQSLAVLEHNEFQNMVGRFHQWLNDNVEALDQDPKNFDQWCELFLAYRAGGLCRFRERRERCSRLSLLGCRKKSGRPCVERPWLGKHGGGPCFSTMRCGVRKGYA